MTKLISSEEMGVGVNVLLCPCGNSYVHIKKVSSAGEDAKLELDCEHGHRFVVVFQQLKGNTHVNASIVEPPRDPG
jgi:hypothetical protein